MDPRLLLDVIGSFQAKILVLAVFGSSVFLVLAFVASFMFRYLKELRSNDNQAPVAGSIFSQIVNFNRLFDYKTSLARKYATYRFIAPSHSEIFTVDPVNVEYILKTKFPNYVKGAYNYDIMRDLFGDGIFAVDGDNWRHQRKLASYEFSTRVLREFSTSVFHTNASRLVAKVSEAAEAMQSSDMQDMFRRATLDSIFKVGFGVDLNTLSGSDEFGINFTKAFDDSNVIVYWRYVDPLWKVKRFLNIGLEASLKRNIKVIDDSIFQLISRKRDQMKNGMTDMDKEDILSRFLVESEKDPEGITDQYLRDITLNFIIAGRDTSANTLAWFFYMLCKNPEVQEKVADDVKKATQMKSHVKKHELSEAGFPQSVTEEALNNMQYLHAALTETLRLFPAVPVDGKSSMEDDILPDGLKVKKGDGISYMAYAMGRMTSIWGEDAEIFRPERWLDENEVFRPESPYKFTAFQAGPRICLGKEFAYRQMKILAAYLLNYFEFRLVDETKEAKYRTMFTLHMDEGLQVYAFPRS